MIFTKHHFTDRETGRLRGEPRGASESKLDTKGYISMRNQIKRLEDAGERLRQQRIMESAIRNGQYDSQDDNFDGAESPLLDPDLIPSVDIDRIGADLESKLSTGFPGSTNGATINKSSEMSEEPEKTGVSGDLNNQQ